MFDFNLVSELSKNDVAVKAPLLVKLILSKNEPPDKNVQYNVLVTEPLFTNFISNITLPLLPPLAGLTLNDNAEKALTDVFSFTIDKNLPPSPQSEFALKIVEELPVNAIVVPLVDLAEPPP
jgi:hypothetical protein